MMRAGAMLCVHDVVLGKELTFLYPAPRALRPDNLSQQKPALFIIAGPVGAGKTTFYEAYLKEPFPNLVPALRHQQQPFLDQRRSFAVEGIRVATHCSTG
jgi:hypothetical protein